MDTENSSDTEPIYKEETKEIEAAVADETVCWSPRFEFDAPRYTNFSSKKYLETGKLLRKLVLNQDEEEEKEEEMKEIAKGTDNEMAMDLDIYEIVQDSSSDSSDIDAWFDRFHPLHEPLRPMTPPGPLISPERSLNASFKLVQSLKASPLKLDSSLTSEASPRRTEMLNTPSKGPNTRIGLRSKPARVLKDNNNRTNSTSSNTDNRYYNGGTSINSSPSSLIRSNFSYNNNSPKSPIRKPPHPNSSPIKNFQSFQSSPIRNTYSPLRSLNSSPIRNPQNTQNTSPLRNNNLLTTPTRLSTASSITLSVSSLTKTFYNTDTDTKVDSVNSTSNCEIPTSPLKMKTKFSEGNASPLRKAVNILQIEEPKVTKKRTTPESHVAAVNEVKKSRSMNAELEDIKKLLSQHNNRIRPHNKR